MAMAAETTATQRRAASSGAPPSSVATGSSATTASGGGSSAAMLPLRVLSKTPAILTILLRVLLWPLLKLVNAAFPSREYDGINNSSGSDRAARAFVAMFQKQISVVRPVMPGDGDGSGREHYVEPPCPFSPRGYNLTLSDITDRPPNTRPLLLLYLHSPLHPDGARFTREYLCHPQLLQLLNSNNSDRHGSVACFGANVHTADGQRVRDMLGVTSFPFLALLIVKSGGSSGNLDNGAGVPMELLLRMEGPSLMKIPPPQITTYLNTAVTRQAEVLAAEEARRLQREEDQRLREEQNREYQEALLADQMREVERREAAERERREREEREEVERSRKAKEEGRLEDARATIEQAGEPPAGSAGVVRMRFALPNGKRVDRRFRAADTIGILRAFLVVYFHEQGIDMKNFGLSTNFPRKTFGEEEDGLTLELAGLTPQAVVMVQDLDS